MHAPKLERSTTYKLYTLRNLCLHKVSQEQKTLKVATPRFYSQVPDLFHPTGKQTQLSYFNAKPRTDGVNLSLKPSPCPTNLLTFLKVQALTYQLTAWPHPTYFCSRTIMWYFKQHDLVSLLWLKFITLKLNVLQLPQNTVLTPRQLA